MTHDQLIKLATSSAARTAELFAVLVHEGVDFHEAEQFSEALHALSEASGRLARRSSKYDGMRLEPGPGFDIPGGM